MNYDPNNNQFEAYSLNDKKRVILKIQGKMFSNIRGHLTYNLIGYSPTGYKVSVLVNKEQWDKYDVPVEERKTINKWINRTKKRIKRLAITPPEEKKIPKNKRKVYNEEIEKWLVEHYDLTVDDIKKAEDEEI